MPRKPSRRRALAALVPLLALFITAAAAAADSAGTVSFTSAAYDVDEGAGAATVTLTRTGGAGGEVTAKVSVTGGTAGAADYRLRPGEVDPSFTRSSSIGSIFEDSLAVQPDGKILIGQGGTVQRLLPNGSLDPSFTRPTLNGHVTSVAVLPDGKILIAGSFTIASGEARGRVARLNPDGTLDASFNGTAALVFDDWPYVVAPTPDGKVMVGGYFTTISGAPRSHLARLNSDGTLDSGFNPPSRSNVYSMLVQPDGKVVAAGFGLYRYNLDGGIDTGFNGGVTPVTGGAQLALALRPDGRLLVGGNFNMFNGAPSTYLIQLDADGSLDSSFNPGSGPDASVFTMALQPDGRLLVGGVFSVYNGVVRDKHVARINPDGSLDASFDPNAASFISNGAVYALRLQPDGKVVAAGTFGGVIGRLFGDVFVTWKDGDAQDKSVTVPVLEDLLDEPDETVDLTLTPVTGGAATGAIPSATLTIRDNDVPPSFTSAPPANPIAKVPYSHTFQAAGVPSPTFTLTAGTLPPGLFLSSSGVLSGTTFSTGTFAGITVRASNGVAPPATQTFDLTVLSGGSFQFNSTTYSVAENGGSATITVNRVGGSTGAASVTYSTFGNTASSGTDFAPASGTLSFAEGETSKSFSVTVNDDAVNERDETVSLSLNTAGGSGTLGSPTFATLTITNDDPLPTISIDDVIVTEGDGGFKQATFVVTRTGLIDRTINFSVSTINGTAVANEDFTPLTNSNVIMPSNVLAVGVNVNLLGDTIVEPDKSFRLRITGATNATVARAEAVGTIKDDDTTTGIPTVQFNARETRVSEGAGVVTLTVSRSGDSSAPTVCAYITGQSSFGSGLASDRSDYAHAFGYLKFAAGETSKSFQVFITDDAHVEGEEVFQVYLGTPSGGATIGAPSFMTVRIVDNEESTVAPNPIDGTQFFVRQQYRDFLNRDPDADGLAHWTNVIDSCGSDAQCREVRRINVSAAFFLSIEFKETGYLIYLLHKAAFNTGERLNYFAFLAETQEIGRGVVVLAPGWEEAIEANKRSFIDSFVQYPDFVTAYQGMTAAQFVDALNANTGDPLNPTAGGSLTQAERDQLVADLTSGAKTRAQVLRAVAENPEFQRRQASKAFVLMQYFGYLRRAPDDLPNFDFSGYNFWLGNLNRFNGNFEQAELVKAFISSAEYRQRFGQ